MPENMKIHALLMQKRPGPVLAMLLRGMHFHQENDGLHIRFAHDQFARFHDLHREDMEKFLAASLGPGPVIYDSEPSSPPEAPDQPDVFANLLPVARNLPAVKAARMFCAGTCKRLVICGETDCGKSHLLALMEEHLALGGKNVLRMGAADTQRMEGAEILLVDEVDHVCGNLPLQNRLCRQMDLKPVAVAMNIGPGAWARFSPRLVSRLSAALTVDMYLPDLPARIKFVSREAEGLGIKLAQPQIMTLARHAAGFSALRGLLQKIAFYEKLSGYVHPLEELEKLANPANQPPGWEKICNGVARRTGTRQADIIGPGRKQDVARARQAAMYLCRVLLGLSYREIGTLFGGRDHATVIHAIKKVGELRKVDKVLHILLTEMEGGMP